MAPSGSFLKQMEQAYAELRRQMKAKFNRFVPAGDLLEDRWSRARAYGFGEGTSVYDSAVVLGSVNVGKNCWIGPFTYLDGSGGVTIGDNVTVGAGSFIASHSSVMRDLTGGRAALEHRATAIGDRVFIAPHCVVEMGVSIGSECVIMAKSVVKRSVPPRSVVFGNPARVVGSVTAGGAGGTPRFRFNRLGVRLLGQPGQQPKNTKESDQ